MRQMGRAKPPRPLRRQPHHSPCRPRGRTRQRALLLSHVKVICSPTRMLLRDVAKYSCPEMAHMERQPELWPPISATTSPSSRLKIRMSNPSHFGRACPDLASPYLPTAILSVQCSQPAAILLQVWCLLWWE